MKILSWNVNGIRAIIKKDFVEIIRELDPDILCLQETKASSDQVKEVLFQLDEYHVYANHSKEKKGYAGTAVLTKAEPMNITFDMGIEAHDQEGRVITAEFDDYYLVNVYVPNSGSELKRLNYRQAWDADFLKYLKTLEKQKPVVACGDFNVAHKAIDLARPKANYNKSAGYMQEEIDGMDNYLAAGLLDTFRVKYPDLTDKYSWWSYRAGARAKNVGWRIDYFLVSQSFEENVSDAFILNDVNGSDHCPVGISTQ